MNIVVAEQSFQCPLPGDNYLDHHTLQAGDSFSWERHFHRDSLQPPLRGPYRILLTKPCAAKSQGMGSWVHGTHLKKAPDPDWTWTPSGHENINTSQIERENIWGDSFPPHVRTRPAFLFSLLLLLPLLCKEHAFFCISQSLAKGGNLFGV